MGHKKKVMVSAFLFFFFILTFLFINKKIRPNLILADRYEVRGVDVSHYQGDIDWEKMAAENIDFAYIKATEGSRYVDERFRMNWENIEQTDLYYGAYHFFSFDSAGETQAQHYISTVGSLEGRLIPVVDVEYYGDKRRRKKELDRETIKRELDVLLCALEEEYHVKPILYTTYPAYHDLIEGSFDEYGLWIRNVYYMPDIGMKGRWLYWQYTDRAEFDAYIGEEPYIDMNVFAGGRAEFSEMVLPDKSALE
ncbi:MAG: glycoside hydrolase family 25 [Lachnospiraceae bacterium]|nr:glycoside hydrolase family 25 [Lachnospiraceae bacterium]